MSSFGVIVLVVAGLLVLTGLFWRFASRRHSLPCPVWLRWFVELDNPFTRISRAATITQHLELKPGMSVLDVGCGPGRVTIPVARQVGPEGNVVAVDIQAGMLERARYRTEQEGLGNIRFQQLAVGEGNGLLGHEQFDRALLVTVLGEIPDRETALKEIFEVLKPGGILSVTEIIFDPHFQSRTRVSGLARSAGFREIAFFGNRIAYTMNLEKPAS